MNDTRSQIIMWLFSFVPYVLVSWGYAELSHGDSKEFWSALGALLLARLFFSIIETLGGVLSWHLYGKKLMVNKHVEFLRVNNFPKREYAHDDISNYLSRIENEPDYPALLKTAAKKMLFVLEASERFGILLGMRMDSAAEAALDIYSPRSEAPVLGASAV